MSVLILPLRGMEMIVNRRRTILMTITRTMHAAEGTWASWVNRCVCKVLRLFVLKVWASYCEDHGAVNESQLFGPCLIAAVQEYNSYVTACKLPLMSGPIVVTDSITPETFRDFVRSNWYAAIVKDGKLSSPTDAQPLLPSNYWEDDWNALRAGVEARRRVWRKYFSFNIAHCITNSLRRWTSGSKGRGQSASKISNSNSIAIPVASSQAMSVGSSIDSMSRIEAKLEHCFYIVLAIARQMHDEHLASTRK